MPRARGDDGAGRRVDGEVDHGDELPRRDLSDDDLVRGREEIGGARMFSRERPEDELRHGHVGGRLDSVPRDVAEHHGELAVAELEEVVDVTADVDARRRLVHLADVETLELRVRARQQRAPHRVGELLLLLVETPVVDRQRGLCCDRERRIQRFARDRPAGVEGDERQRSDHLARRRNRNDRRGRALLQERGEQSMRATELVRQLRRQQQRAPSAEQPPDRHGVQRLRPRQRRDRGIAETHIGDEHGPLLQQLSTCVRHPDHRRVDAEQLDRAPRQRIERGVERQALRERLRDVVERPHAPGGFTFCVQRAVELERRASSSARAGARSAPRSRAAPQARRAALRPPR